MCLIRDVIDDHVRSMWRQGEGRKPLSETEWIWVKFDRGRNLTPFTTWLSLQLFFKKHISCIPLLCLFFVYSGSANYF